MKAVIAFLWLALLLAFDLIGSIYEAGGLQ